MNLFNRIDKKLLSCILLLAIVPLCIAIFIAYNIGVKSIKEQTFENLTVAAEAIKSNVYIFITAQKNIARDFSSDMAIKDFLKGLSDPATNRLEIIEGLKRQIMVNKIPLYAPSILGIDILNDKGIVVFSTDEATIGKDDSMMDYFVRASRDGYFGDMYYSALFNEPVCEVSAPIIDNDTNSLLGVIVNRISGDTLANITKSSWIEDYISPKDTASIAAYFYGKSLKREEGRHTISSAPNKIYDVYIVNKDKQMITESRVIDNTLLSQIVDTEPVQKGLINGEDMIGIYKDYRGRSVIGASIWIEELKWIVIAEKYLPHALALLFRLKAQMITCMIVMLGIAAVVSYVFSRRLTEPIKRLIEATRVYSKGEFRYRVKVSSTDELGVLAASFNNMCDAIEKATISRNYFERIINGMNESLIVTGLDYNIRFVNPATLKMVGYEADELIGKPIFTIINERFPRLELEYEEDLFQDGYGDGFNIQNLCLTYRTKDALLIPVSFSSFFLNDCIHKLHRQDCETRKEGKCLRCKHINIVNIAHDISGHKEAEAELQEAKEAAEATARLRSEFLATMSHEVRAPLNVILGMSDALQEQAYGPLNERQANALHSIREGGIHLLSLINDILDVSKIEAGRLRLEIGTVSVKPVCEASLLFIKQDAHKKRIKVLKNYDSAVSMLQADERRLKQILVNLLTNAVKFTQEAGTIGLDVVGDREKQSVNFIVWDTGVGLSQEDMDRLFEPFMQFNSAKSGNHLGTGLGLSLVKQMTELHGGHVSVECGEGKGCRFTVSLPWRSQGSGCERLECVEDKGELVGSGRHKDKGLEGNVAAVKILGEGTYESVVIISEPDKELKDRSPLVLIVDDDIVNIDVFSTYLEAKGFRIAIARNGREAIDSARQITPDIILMDIQMPEMDGVEAARHIREDSVLKDVPIIALTAIDAPFYRERCLNAGMNDFINKPVSLEGLVNAIKTQLRR